MLLECGHPYAPRYPLAKLVSESDIVDERRHSVEVTRAVLLQLAISSVLSKEGAAGFRKSVENLSIELEGT